MLLYFVCCHFKVQTQSQTNVLVAPTLIAPTVEQTNKPYMAGTNQTRWRHSILRWTSFGGGGQDVVFATQTIFGQTAEYIGYRNSIIWEKGFPVPDSFDTPTYTTKNHVFGTVLTDRPKFEGKTLVSRTGMFDQLCENFVGYGRKPSVVLRLFAGMYVLCYFKYLILTKMQF